MLLSFRVKNFMSFRDETLFSLEPDLSIKYSPQDICEDSALKIAAVFGANASGKSTLLKAIDALCSILNLGYNEDKVSEVIVPFVFNTENSPVEFEILFSSGAHEYQYGISFNDGIVAEEFLCIDSHQFFTRSMQELSIAEDLSIYKDIAQPWYSFIGAFRKLMPNRLAPLLSDFYSFFTSKLIIIQSAISNDLRISIDKILMEDETLFKQVESLVVQADTGINGLVFVPTFPGSKNKILQTIHRVYGSDGNVVGTKNMYLNSESNGTAMFIYYAAIILLTLMSNGVLCIDELSSVLHPLLSRFLIDYFCKNSHGAQLIFTTHDASLMDGFLRRDEVNLITKTAQGVSSITTLADFVATESQSLISQKYYQGHFAGIPDIRGDFDAT